MVHLHLHLQFFTRYQVIVFDETLKKLLIMNIFDLNFQLLDFIVEVVVVLRKSRYLM